MDKRTVSTHTYRSFDGSYSYWQDGRFVFCECATCRKARRVSIREHEGIDWGKPALLDSLVPEES